MRLDSAIALVFYVIFKLLQAGRLGRTLGAALAQRRSRRRVAAERELLRRLERAITASDAGWTRRL